MKECYLGVDIGSISTKGVIIDENNNIITSSYIWTEGNPKEAVKKLIDKLGLDTNKWGCIVVNENYKTSDDKVYAIGDLAGNKQTVAWAARSGFECAKIIVNEK